jgi:methylenetetrahydrofolate dehydrogenase (NADP+)/methenyltetrahydrofolate cyclohydrolase
LVGDDPGSIAYVEGKHRDCAQVGIKSIKVNLPATATTSEVIAAVEALNTDPNCTGFIVQLPLPAGVDTQKVLSAIAPTKDADGLTPINLGNLVLGFNTVVACTPKAILALLAEYKVNLTGAKVLVIGRGMTVGRPLSILLSQKPINATVTLAHSISKNLNELIKDADVVIAAMGSSQFIHVEMVKRGAVLVDVGITRDGNELVGDFNPNVVAAASAFAPMPGGVGPMTRAMLLKNVFELAKNEK